jgi:hypothetical protein
MGNTHMSNVATVDRSVDEDARRGPNVVDVGAWLNSAKAIRRELADYVPRHRAPGLAV